MKRLWFYPVFFSLLCLPASAQEIHSLQFNGGIISPMSSSKGLSGSIQLNYKIVPNVFIYLSSGYAYWDKYNVIFYEELTGEQKQQTFKTNIESDHILIPIIAGSRIDLHTNKLFTSFINFDIGYSYLSFMDYNVYKEVNPDNGVVLNYRTDYRTGKENEEHLFSIGIGAGISHSMTENVNLLLAFKLNSYINSNYFGLFSTRGTYTTVTAGFNFLL